MWVANYLLSHIQILQQMTLRQRNQPFLMKVMINFVQLNLQQEILMLNAKNKNTNHACLG